MSHIIAGIENRCSHSSPFDENLLPVPARARARQFRGLARDSLGHRHSQPRPQPASLSNFADNLLARAGLLAPPDRDLLIAVFSKNVTCASIARAGGHDPRTTRRRVRRLTHRVMSPTFELCAARVLAKSAGGWSPTRRAVAERVILQGQAYRTAATELGLSIHSIRAHVIAIRALASGVVR